MKENPEFYEIQRFRQWWLWLIIFFVLGFSAYNSYENAEYFSRTELIISTAVPVVIFFLFFIIKLETKIDHLGIRVRLFPFHLQFKYFPWKNIDKAFIRQYSPLMDYGGWGLRIISFGRGKAYNISGNMGLQLVFKDGKKLLIGTQKAVEMKQFLEEIKNLSRKY
ncbi:hypothetical protein ASG31_14215 [Chryseobacterium sp. Leaf404]|uniref:hypothetical protein n=1 Tax=unclassified Chryseobacterium TaxID=2593645 RepID=UPI0006FAFC85|nr:MULTISPECIES: hypothetical protein [unclassified Chryseobacterium]KQT16121.1 hypothetical protein ASG31_14215 [Chryseobacterium sp. Leaf404]